MVDFTPTINPTNDPNYLGLSQAPEKQASLSPLASIFNNVASIGDAAVKATDTIIKDKAKDDLRAGIEGIQNDAGVGEATALAASGIPPTNVRGDSASMANIFDPAGAPTTAGVAGGKIAKGAPPGVAKLGESFADLTDKYNKGDLSNSYYLGRMNALVSQVSAQFPGYKEDIISMATQMLGVNPANALRKSLLDDLDQNARANAAGHNKEDQFVLSKIDEFGAQQGPALWAAYKNKTLDFNNFVSLYAQRKGATNDITLARSTLGLIKDSDEFDKTQTEKKVGGLFSTLVMNDLHTGIQTQVGNMSLADIQGRIHSAPEKPLGGKEQETLKAATSSLMAQKRAQLQAEADRIDPTSKKSFSQVMGPEATERAINYALRPFTEVTDALTSDKRGIQGYWASVNKSMVDERTRKVIDNDTTEALANAQVVKNIYGPEGVNWVLSQPNNFAPHIKALTGAMTYKLSAGKVGSLGAEVQSGQKREDLTPPEKEQLALGQIESAVKLLISPEAKPGEVENAATAIFGDKNNGFLNLFRGDTQPKVYARLVNQDVQQRILATGNTELIGKYQKFSLNSFKALYQRSVQDLQAAGVESAYYDVKFNYDTNHYEAHVREGYAERGQLTKALQTGRVPNPSEIPRRIQAPLDRINSGIDTVTPVLKMTGQDVRPLIRSTLAVMGYHPEPLKPGEERPRDRLFKPNYDDSYLKLPGDE